MKYKYILIHIEQIVIHYGLDYYQEHIKKSLDSLFEGNVDLTDWIITVETTESGKDLPVIGANDVSDENLMQLFFVHNVTNFHGENIVTLEYSSRLKG